MTKRLLALSTGIVLAAGCASTSPQWTPTVDTYGNSRAQYLTRDLDECRGIAEAASGSIQDETAKGAGVGALGGAAAGAVVGAMLGSASKGAVLGAATGGAGMAAVRGTRAQAQFEEAYRNCLRGRGHNVIG